MTAAKSKKLRHVSVAGLLAAVLLFCAASFTMLAFSKGAFDYRALLFALLLCAVTVFAYIALVLIAPHADRCLFILVAFLVILGLTVQYRMSASAAMHQLLMTLAGYAAMLGACAVMKKAAILKYLSIPFAAASILVLAALLFVGKESGGAKNWISVGGTLVQPSEFVKVALVIVLSAAMARDGINKRPTVRELVPSMLFTACIAALLVMEKDLGAAMLAAGVFVMMFFTATGRFGTTLLIILAGAAAAVAAYYVFEHVRVRVEVWQDPWATYSTSGYQIAQGLMAIASGGLWGEGLGMGSPSLIPAYRTDYVFAVICEEFGIVFGVGLIAVYAIIVVRGVLIALSSKDGFRSLCAFGSAAFIALQTFIIIGGVIKLIPLTGITLPFVSYGGSSMIAFMTFIGIMQGIASANARELERELDDEHDGGPDTAEDEP